ncbi:CvpA family protein [Verrucomicrobia bacterium]|nr:CvpA family protein [Verrucomicrobiota bacterium]MDC0263525.1 CvpA family protein [Verrucomicrobiota bacterium]MDC0266787.1 CvpA family protein [bacterium]
MIWLVAILLLAVFAGVGYLKGAIRMSVSLAGLFVGLMLAKPMAPMMTPIYTASGMTNLLWLSLLPPITAFFVVGLVFVVIGFIVHYKIGQYYKFSADEVTRLTWERMNKRSGAALGLLVGGIYTVLVGMLIYVGGYLTTQVATENDQGPVGYLNSLAAGLESSGLGKIARSISPVPEKYFKVADILGMSHKTPLLEVRYRNYPPFLNLGEESTIEEMGSNDEYHNLLIQQASLDEIIKHPISVKLMSDQALTDRLLATDLDDLRAYLETGESPRYADELFLGRWELDGNATINYFKKNTIGVKARQIREMKEVVTNWLLGMSMVVYPDQTYTVSNGKEEEDEKPEEKEPDAYEDPYAGFAPQQGMDAEMAARYGLPPGQGAQGQRRPLAQAPKPRRPQLKFSEQGRWDRKTRGRYQVQASSGGGSVGSVVVRKNHRAYIDTEGMTLVFKRVW